MKSRKFKSFLFLVVMFTAITFSCDDSMPEPIYGSKPTVAFTATQSASDIYTWSFTNSSSGAISYNWNFGDGNGSSDANPSHTYSGAGSYTVTLTATAAGTSNALGWRQSVSQGISIELPTYETADVSFSVDMNNAALSSGNLVKLTGTFEGFTGNNSTLVMSDDDSDGVYEITIPLATNTVYDYKFIVDDGTGQWNGQEIFDEGDDCARDDGNGYWNRYLTVNNLEQTQTVPTACFDSCADCIDYGALLIGSWSPIDIYVGSSRGSDEWWGYLEGHPWAPGAGSRPCWEDDFFEFKADGTFTVGLGDATYLEPWQNVAEGCGSPIAPWISASHTYTFDQATLMLTVIGDGAYLGGPQKAHNNGEDGISGGQIEYHLTDVTDTELHVDLQMPGGWWAVVLKRN